MKRGKLLKWGHDIAKWRNMKKIEDKGYSIGKDQERTVKQGVRSADQTSLEVV